MHIREAQIADAAAIAKVHVDSWNSTYRGIVPQDYLDGLSYEKGTRAWQVRISLPASLWFTYIAVTDEGKTVGFVSAGPERTGDQIYSGEIGGLYLLETYQRQGIGRRLVRTAATRLQQQGHNSMMVWVLAQNDSRHFYEAMGGQFLREQKIEIGGISLMEVAYGWLDIATVTEK